MGKKKRGRTRGAAPRRRHVTPGEAQPLPGQTWAGRPSPIAPGQPPPPDQVDIAAFPGRARGRPRPLGTVERDVRLVGGTTIGAGSPVYPVSEAEARGLPAGDRAAVALSEATHAEGALRLSRGSLHEYNLELPGLIRSAPGGKTGGQVLDLHGELIDSLKNPDPGLRDFYRDFVSRGAEAMAAQPDTLVAAAWGYMFVGVTSGDELLALIARQLDAAATCTVTREMAAAVSETYRKHPHEVSTMTAADLPDLDGNDVAGFAWLDEPVTLTDAGGTVVMVRAVSWCRQVADLARDTWAGVRVTSWAGVEDRDGYWDADAAETMRQLGELALSHSVFVPFGQRFARPASDPVPDDITRWLFVLWQYLRQQLAVAPRAHVERHAARRAARRSMKSEVRVIMLRRTYAAADPDAEPSGRVYSCQWPVDPFTRHKAGFRSRGFAPHQAQPQGPGKACAVCGHGTTGVRSHTKGPAGAPWKPKGQKIFRLAR